MKKFEIRGYINLLKTCFEKDNCLCKFCEKTFYSRNSIEKCKSRRCANCKYKSDKSYETAEYKIHIKEYQKKYYLLNNKRISEYHKQYNKKQLKKTLCKHCEKFFEISDARRKFCSDLCRKNQVSLSQKCKKKRKKHAEASLNYYYEKYVPKKFPKNYGYADEYIITIT